jgi:hypothetical protein
VELKAKRMKLHGALGLDGLAVRHVSISIAVNRRHGYGSSRPSQGRAQLLSPASCLSQRQRESCLCFSFLFHGDLHVSRIR